MTAFNLAKLLKFNINRHCRAGLEGINKSHQQGLNLRTVSISITYHFTYLTLIMTIWWASKSKQTADNNNNNNNGGNNVLLLYSNIL